MKWPDGPIKITIISITYTLLSLSNNVSSPFLTSCTKVKSGMNIIWPSSDPFPSFLDIFNWCNSLSKKHCHSTQWHRPSLKKHPNFLNATQKKHSPSIFSHLPILLAGLLQELGEFWSLESRFFAELLQKCKWEGTCISWWGFPKKEQNHLSYTLNCGKNLRQEGTMSWGRARVSVQNLSPQIRDRIEVECQVLC